MFQKMSHPRTCQIKEKKYINNNNVWSQKNVTTIRTNYPVQITDFMNTFKKCTKKICPKHLGLKTVTISSIHSNGKPGLF